MTDFKWGALGTESSNIASTAMNSKSDGATTFISDIDNSSNRALNLHLRVELGSITTAAGASVTFELRIKDGSGNYAMNAVSLSSMEVKTTGAGAKYLQGSMQMPGGHVFGLYWTNNLGTTSASSGNALYTRSFNEADS